MSRYSSWNVIDCENLLYFKAECRESGNPVTDIRSNCLDVEHVVTAGVYAPHQKYDLVVETRVNGKASGQLSFRHSSYPVASTWKTEALVCLSDTSEKDESASVECNITAGRTKIDIESVGTKFKVWTDPNWVLITTVPFSVEINVS